MLKLQTPTRPIVHYLHEYLLYIADETAEILTFIIEPIKKKSQFTFMRRILTFFFGQYEYQVFFSAG